MFPILSLLFLFQAAFAEHTTIYSPSPSHEVLALGSAFTDYVMKLSDEDMEYLRMEKGSWMPAQIEDIEEILSMKEDIKIVAGGSAVNVIKGLASLGRKCAVIGKVGSDSLGKSYVEKLEKQNIHPILYPVNLPTGRALCLITPDGERTFRTFLGASHERGDLDLNPKDFERLHLFHIEGYQVLDPELLDHALTLASEKRALISMDLGNYELVRLHKEKILQILEKYVDIVFCNQVEAKEITDGMNPMDACCFLSKITDIAIVTMSENGGWVRKGKKYFYFPAIKTKTVDTTGAGDLFSSGFLYGYLKGRPLEECAWIGAYVASNVVQEFGAEISEENWEKITSRIQIEEAMAKKKEARRDKAIADLKKLSSSTREK